MQIEKCLVYFTTSLKGNDILVHRVRNIREFKNTLDQELVEYELTSRSYRVYPNAAISR